MAESLSHATDAMPEASGLRTATVASVLGTGCVMVRMNGALVGPYCTMTHYTATVGDLVALMRQDSTWLVLGKMRIC